VAQAIEERGVGVTFRKVAISMYTALAVALAFYCGIILATSMALPWSDLRSTDLAIVRAMKVLIRGNWAPRIVLIAAAISVLKTWNGVFLWTVRLILGQSRQGYLPTALSRIHSRWQSPHVAVIALATVNVFGVALGRGVIIPLVNVASICLALSLVASCAAAARIRTLNRGSLCTAYRVPGGPWTIGYALAGSSAMGAFAVWEPWVNGDGSIPLEWKLIAVWIATGVLLWLGVDFRRSVSTLS
jgi:amino acid transporter